MCSNKAGQDRYTSQESNAASRSTTVLSQIDLINGSCIFSLFTMTIAALLLYAFLDSQFRGSTLNIWIASILLIDSICLYFIWNCTKRKMTGQVYNHYAQQSILIYTILFGMSWGAAGFFLLPLADVQGKLIILVILLGVVAGITTTLAYQYKYAITFVLLVMLPLMTGIFIVGEIAGVSAILLNMILAIYMVLLFNNIMVLYRNINRLLFQQSLSTDREKKLSLQCEDAIDASRAKSAFLANMSHELRTPMHAILGFSDLGASKVATQPPEKLSSYFMRIHESGQRLLKLLDDLQELSRLETDNVNLDLSEQDISSAIDFVIDKLRPLLEERSLTIDVTSTTDNTVALFDYDQIILVLNNLLLNAIRSSPTSSKITVCIEDAYLSSTDSETETPASAAISISVLDKGTDIAEHEPEAVFDTCVQSTSSGRESKDRCPGLAICKQIIKQHGGEVRAYNNEDSGAALTFIIPRVRA